MNLLDFSTPYDLISRSTENITTRKEAHILRKIAFSSATPGQRFNKLAFDTCRIDQGKM